MKKFILSAFLICLGSAFVHAQCNEFYILSENSEWESESFNAKGKLVGKNAQKVTSFSKTGTGYKAIVNSTLFDAKGKEVSNGDLEMVCENGTFYMDMRNFIPQESLKAYKSAEVKITSENLEIPSKLSAGQSLKDGSVTVTAEGTPIPMKMTLNIIDRKVVGKESITTPAGTFECYKITSKSIMKNQMGMTMTFEFSGTEWIAPGVGMVKSESFDKNGKPNGYTVLTKRK